MEKRLEDELGWEVVMDANDLIGKYLEFKPEIEYSVGDNEGTCYSPKNVGDYFRYPATQKIECERFLQEQKEKYPNSWISKGNYSAQKKEWYPFFHRDFNSLIEAVKKLKAKGVEVEMSLDINELWKSVLNKCSVEK